MYSVNDDDIRDDAFYDAAYGEDPEPAIEDWQLATLDDLDEQKAAERELEIPRKPAAVAATGAAWVLEQVMPLFNIKRSVR